MSKYIYSAETNEFFPRSLEDNYRASGQWPVVGVEFDESDFTYWKSENAPAGKIRVPGADGMPTWGNIPEPTHQQLTEEAERHRQQYLSEADGITADWIVELMLGDITDEDKNKLQLWMEYKRKVKEVDISSVPNVKWPEPPKK
ncbi:tail fiber assembly protein [Enterobacter sp.]|uniref:tail fiber assembly protein n=1 Tax=Enterobacter sp. TaxID=42895 RepID=UPI00296F4B8B|nr:tail fiber assembly protein [Enterobacter sp.]